MKLPTKRLIIWRSLVQAQAGPRFYYSDLRFGVGRCFWFLRKQCVNKLFEFGCVYAMILCDIQQPYTQNNKSHRHIVYMRMGL